MDELLNYIKQLEVYFPYIPKFVWGLLLVSGISLLAIKKSEKLFTIVKKQIIKRKSKKYAAEYIDRKRDRFSYYIQQFVEHSDDKDLYRTCMADVLRKTFSGKYPIYSIIPDNKNDQSQVPDGIKVLYAFVKINHRKFNETFQAIESLTKNAVDGLCNAKLEEKRIYEKAINMVIEHGIITVLRRHEASDSEIEKTYCQLMREISENCGDRHKIIQALIQCFCFVRNVVTKDMLSEFVKSENEYIVSDAIQLLENWNENNKLNCKGFEKIVRNIFRNAQQYTKEQLEQLSNILGESRNLGVRNILARIIDRQSDEFKSLYEKMDSSITLSGSISEAFSRLDSVGLN